MANAHDYIKLLNLEEFKNFLNNLSVNEFNRELFKSDDYLCHKHRDVRYYVYKDNSKATDVIPHTVAHYISPQAGNVSISNESVAEVMQSYGMDVIQICGDQLAEEEGVEEDLGLILEHEADPETDEFSELVERMKICLNQLGWKYDGSVIEECDDGGEDIILH